MPVTFEANQSRPEYQNKPSRVRMLPLNLNQTQHYQKVCPNTLHPKPTHRNIINTGKATYSRRPTGIPGLRNHPGTEMPGSSWLPTSCLHFPPMSQACSVRSLGLGGTSEQKAFRQNPGRQVLIEREGERERGAICFAADIVVFTTQTNLVSPCSSTTAPPNPKLDS